MKLGFLKLPRCAVTSLKSSDISGGTDLRSDLIWSGRMRHFFQLAIEFVAEAKIQRAYDEKKFENLPGFGKPLQLNRQGRLQCWTKQMLLREQNKLSNNKYLTGINS